MKLSVHIRLALMIFLSTSIATGAPRCAVHGRPEAKVISNGARLTLPAIAQDCEGLTLQAGEVHVCVEHQQGRLRCRKFVAMTNFAAAALGPSAFDSGLLDVLLEILRGDAGTMDGKSRGLEYSPLPIGLVAFVRGAIKIDFANPFFANVDRIEFFDSSSGAKVSTVQGEGKVSIRSDQFIPGHRYTWMLRSSFSSVDEKIGRFTVLSADDMRVVQAEVATTDADEPEGAVAQALMLAAWLSKRSLYYDADNILAEEGLRSP